MQILIDIPEKTNSRIRSFLGHGYALRDEDVKIVADAIYNGQPEPKKGKWIEIDDDLISGRCSQCGWEAHLYEDDVFGMDYCPNCGAKMEEEG